MLKSFFNIKYIKFFFLLILFNNFFCHKLISGQELKLSNPTELYEKNNKNSKSYESSYILGPGDELNLEFLGKKPLGSERSIVVIEDIERINESASNALLKTLEEPNTGLFILITQRLEKLLSCRSLATPHTPAQRLRPKESVRILNLFLSGFMNITFSTSGG